MVTDNNEYEIVNGPTEHQLLLAYELFNEGRTVVFGIKINGRNYGSIFKVTGTERIFGEPKPNWRKLKLHHITSHLDDFSLGNVEALYNLKNEGSRGIMKKV